MSGRDLRVIRGGALADRQPTPPDAEAANLSFERRCRGLLTFRCPEGADGWDGIISAERKHGADEASVAAAIDDAERLLRPATADLIVAELTRLRLTTAARGATESELSATFRVYCEELTYPADVIRTACRRGGWSWWPPLEDLRQRCEALVRPRRQMLDALRRPPSGRGTEAPRQPRSEDEMVAASEAAERAIARLRSGAAPGTPRPTPRRSFGTTPPSEEETAALEAAKAAALAELGAADETPKPP